MSHKDDRSYALWNGVATGIVWAVCGALCGCTAGFFRDIGGATDSFWIILAGGALGFAIGFVWSVGTGETRK